MEHGILHPVWAGITAVGPTKAECGEGISQEQSSDHQTCFTDESPGHKTFERQSPCLLTLTALPKMLYPLCY